MTDREALIAIRDATTLQEAIAIAREALNGEAHFDPSEPGVPGNDDRLDLSEPVAVAPRCTCGAKTLQRDHHHFGCPYRLGVSPVDQDGSARG